MSTLSFPRPRWTETPFPPYSYVPGMHPHPATHPHGQSHRGESASVVLSDKASWRQRHAYLYGIDLFNHGYYWEAHEQWEAVWITLGRNGREADFLKGLIKLAAAGVKAREGKPTGVARHAARARQLFQTVAAEAPSQSTLFGCLPVDQLIAAAEELRQHPNEVLNTAVAPVVVVFPFVLMLY